MKYIWICIIVLAAFAGCSNDTATNVERGTGSIEKPGTLAPAQVEYEDCGFIDGEQVDCKEENEICGTLGWKPDVGPKCYPTDICSREAACGSKDCLVLESWPAQIRCGQ